MILILDDLRSLDDRISSLAKRVKELPDKSAGFVDSFFEWLGKWVAWRNEVYGQELASRKRGLAPESSLRDPDVTSKYESWLKDTESWEQGYSFLSSGVMPVRYDSSSKEPPKASWATPVVILVLAVATFFWIRSRP